MTAGDGRGREDAPGRKPVRLSDLAPPGRRGGGVGGPGTPIVPPASGRPAAPMVPSRPPGPPPQNPPGARPAPPSPDALAQLREDLRISEDARRQAEARVVELEVQVAGLSAGNNGGGGAGGNGHAEVERLRQELEQAHGIIRAIEEAYLAGGGEPAPEAGPPPSAG